MGVFAVWNGKFKKRISNIDAVIILALALGFEIAGSGIGATFMAFGAAAATTVAWVPFLGQFVGVLAVAAGFAIGTVLGWLISITAFATIWLFFQLHGAKTFSGEKLAAKLLIFGLALIIEFAPVVNIMLGLTFWTGFSIYITWLEDKDTYAKLMGIEQTNFERLIMALIEEEEYADFAQQAVQIYRDTDQKTLN